MTETSEVGGLPTTSKVLCAVYALIAVVASVATWSQNVAYIDSGAQFVTAFWEDSKVNPAARSVTVDLLLFGLPVLILMVAEARKHGIKFVWAYIAAGFLTAISIVFPLFLIARELRIARTDPTRLRTADTVALTLLGLAIAAFVIWVDLV